VTPANGHTVRPVTIDRFLVARGQSAGVPDANYLQDISTTKDETGLAPAVVLATVAILLTLVGGIVYQLILAVV